MFFSLTSGGSRPSDKGGGGGHPDPEISGGRSLKKIFSALRVSFWSKSKGGAGSPGPSPESATVNYKQLTSASLNEIADKMARTNKRALRKVTEVSTERAVTLLLKLSVISSVW